MEICKICHEPVLEMIQNVRFSEAGLPGGEKYAKSGGWCIDAVLSNVCQVLQGKAACGRRDLGLKCSMSLYSTCEAVVSIKQPGPDFYSCSTCNDCKGEYLNIYINVIKQPKVRKCVLITGQMFQ